MATVPNLPWWVKTPMYTLNKTNSGFCETMGPRVGLPATYWLSELVGKSRRTLTSQVQSYIEGINASGGGPVPYNAKINNLITCAGNVIPTITSYRASDARWTANANIVFVGNSVTADEITSKLGIPTGDVFWDMGSVHFNWKFDVDHDYSVGYLVINMNTLTSSYSWYQKGTYSAGGRQRNIVVDSATYWSGGTWTRPGSRQVVIPAIWAGDGGSQGINWMTCKIRPV